MSSYAAPSELSAIGMEMVFNPRYGLRALATPYVAPIFDYYLSPTGSDSNPGTLAAPFAITSLTTASPNYSKIAGNTIGLLNGTYDVSTLAGDTYSVKLTIPAGTVLKQTVIQAVNQLQAIIVSNPATGGYVAAPVIGNGANGEGEVQTPSYITIRGLTITGGTSAPASVGVSGVSYAGSSPDTCPGLIIDSCEIYNFVNPNDNGNIGCVIFGTGPTGAIVSNCKLHDCYTSGKARNAHANSSGVHDYSNNMIVEYCTIYDCNNGVYQKNQNATPPPGGMTVRSCYFWYGNSGMSHALDGFNNSSGTSPPYTPQAFYNNVFENVGGIYNSNTGVEFIQAPTQHSNNTWVWTNSTYNIPGIGPWPGPTAGAPWKFMSHYNNILYRTVSPDSEWGDLTFGPSYGDWTICDYNCYPSSSTSLGVAANQSSPPGSFSNLPTWQGKSGTPDTHSTVADPLMVFEQTSIVLGGGTAQYKLQGVSPCKATGQSGADMGAWGGSSPPSQIGSNI